MKLTVLMMCISLIIPQSVLGAESSDPVPDEVVLTLATDRSALLEELAMIRDVYREAAAALKNIRVSGRFLPGDLRFTLVVKDGRHRFDRTVINSTNTQETIYRLFDGRTYALLNVGQIGLLPLDNFRQHWHAQSVGELSGYIRPEPDDSRSVDEYCQYLIDFLTLTGEFADPPPGVRDYRPVILIRRGDGFTTIDHFTSADWETAGGMRYSVKLDDRAHYAMVWSANGQENQPGVDRWHYRVEITSKYSEIASGVYFLKEGSVSIINETGPPPVTRTPREKGVVVDTVEFGDFEVPDDYFVLASLPIARGISVHDERTTPAADFIWKEGPFEESVLERAVAEAPPARQAPGGYSRTQLLLALNLFGVISLGLYGILRRRSRATKGAG